MKAHLLRQVLLFRLLLVARRDGLMYQQHRQPARFCNRIRFQLIIALKSRSSHDSGSGVVPVSSSARPAHDLPSDVRDQGWGAVEVHGAGHVVRAGACVR